MYLCRQWSVEWKIWHADGWRWAKWWCESKKKIELECVQPGRQRAQVQVLCLRDDGMFSYSAGKMPVWRGTVSFGFPSIWGEAQNRLLSPWSWVTELGRILAYVTWATHSMLEMLSLEIHRSDAHLSIPYKILSVWQRIWETQSILPCSDCKAGCCDMESCLISHQSYSLRIQLENICPGGCLLWFRHAMVVFG